MSLFLGLFLIVFDLIIVRPVPQIATAIIVSIFCRFLSTTNFYLRIIDIIREL